MIEVNHHIELKAEIEAFTASYDQCQQMIGCDDAKVIDAVVIDDTADIDIHGPR